MDWIRFSALGAFLTPLLALGHHSTTEYNRDVIREYTGEIVRLQWRNPHVRMSVRVSNNGGVEEVWEMEAQDLNSLDRAGVPRDLVEVGQVVRIAGSPSTRRERALAVTNLMLPDGTEVILRTSAAPRWADEVIGDGQAVRGRPEDFQAPVDDIFRVWTTVRSNRPDFSDDPPLTVAARLAYESFDSLNDDPVLGCTAPGMPEAMTYIGPHPVEFAELDDGNIRIRIESDDSVRLIHMGDGTNAEDQPPSSLGYSAGSWEDNVLVVTTTRISWPYFKVHGLVAAPQSEAMEIVERFALDRNRGELDYSFTATDPATFTEPVTAEGYHQWRYRPGVEVEPYECTLEEWTTNLGQPSIPAESLNDETD